MSKIIPEDNELGEMSLFQSRIKRFSSWGVKQDRILVFSTHFLYITKGTEIVKKYGIYLMRYIVECPSSSEILVYFSSYKNLRMVLMDTQAFTDLVRLRFPIFCPNDVLRYYIVNDKSSL